MKANFRYSDIRLVNHFSRTISIQKFSSISKVGDYAERTLGEGIYIDASISNLSRRERERLSFDVNIYSQILKLKTLSTDVSIGDIFLLEGRQYEAIEISNYWNSHGQGLKIYIGLKRGLSGH